MSCMRWGTFHQHLGRYLNSLGAELIYEISVIKEALLDSFKFFFRNPDHRIGYWVIANIWMHDNT